MSPHARQGGAVVRLLQVVSLPLIRGMRAFEIKLLLMCAFAVCEAPGRWRH